MPLANLKKSSLKQCQHRQAYDRRAASSASPGLRSSQGLLNPLHVVLALVLAGDLLGGL
jgi:hypothetical protein